MMWPSAPPSPSSHTSLPHRGLFSVLWTKLPPASEPLHLSLPLPGTFLSRIVCALTPSHLLSCQEMINNISPNSLSLTFLLKAALLPFSLCVVYHTICFISLKCQYLFDSTINEYLYSNHSSHLHDTNEVFHICLTLGRCHPYLLLLTYKFQPTMININSFFYHSQKNHSTLNINFEAIPWA